MGEAERVSSGGNGVPEAGPWYGDGGGSCVSWTMAVTVSNRNSSTSTIAVGRRIRPAG